MHYIGIARAVCLDLYIFGVFVYRRTYEVVHSWILYARPYLRACVAVALDLYREFLAHIPRNVLPHLTFPRVTIPLPEKIPHYDVRAHAEYLYKIEEQLSLATLLVSAGIILTLGTIWFVLLLLFAG